MPQPIAPPAVLTLLEGATRAVAGSLRRETAMKGLAGWDSLGIVQFLAEVADRTGATFHVADVRQAATAGELVDLVVARAGGG